MYDIPEEKLKELLLIKKMTDAQAALCLGVSKETIRRRRVKLDLPAKPKRRERPRGLTEEQEVLIREMYERGHNDYYIASKMHVGRECLRKWRRKNGVSSQTNKKGLTKEDAEIMSGLLSEGRTLTDIGKSFGVQRTSVARCLKRHGYTYETYRPQHPEWVDSYTLTHRQEQILIGDLLGDGALVPTSPQSAYMQFGHAIDQEQFVRWKMSEMEPLSSNVSSYLKHNSLLCKTWTSPVLGEWYKTFYPRGKKEISSKIIDMLGDLGLAVWYMGDGSLIRNTPVIHVGLSVDVTAIVSALNKKFGPVFKEKRYEKEWHIKVKDRSAFFGIVTPHIIEYFRYKVPEGHQNLLRSCGGSLFIRPEEFKTLSIESQEEIIDKLSSYYRARGFPYPSYGYATIRRDCRALLDVDVRDISFALTSLVGRKTCNNFMRHRYDARRYDSDPMSHWRDPKKYRKFIRNRLTYSDGSVTDSSIRTGISLKGIPANFSPTLAKHIYKRYGKPGGRVLDFSAGYGGRLLGWMSSGLSGTYEGTEPCSKSYQGLCRMTEYCSKFFGLDPGQVIIHREPFEDVNLTGTYDMVMSSPPYFGLERYSEEDNQSIVRYPDYSEWLEKFWGILVSRVHHHLKSGSLFIYSIGNYGSYDLVSDMREAVLGRGFLEMDHDLRFYYRNVYRGTTKSETICVFRK
ncbi:MAG: hypothetical protein GF334_07205 [Candidatus Altiarchaeales archaeon]|nr:hypothetical protein [Candidatus Altiarchaeales archaeon]